MLDTQKNLKDSGDTENIYKMKQERKDFLGRRMMETWMERQVMGVGKGRENNSRLDDGPEDDALYA